MTAQIRGRKILITGGEGFVGGELVKTLEQFAPGKIVTVDIATKRQDIPADRQHYQINIGDLDTLADVFENEKPEIVFHLAAEREPERAEQQIKNTVRSNIIGTENVLRLCEDFGVHRCVYSSSGKAARYHSPDMYAGSKKLTEWQLAQAAEAAGDGTYSAVRFTHVLENSIVHQEMTEKINRGIVSFHSPDRYMYVQTKAEAVHLLLNSLALEGSSNCRLLTVKDLGWPMEVLTIPLYEMKARGQIRPLYFRGLPDGYEGEFFRGQLDYSVPHEMNPMINMLETPYSETDASGDMTVTHVTSFSFVALNRALQNMRAVGQSPETTGAMIKHQLSQEIQQVTQTSFEQASVLRGWNILRSGIDPRVPDLDQVISSHRETIELIARGVVPRLTNEHLTSADQKRPYSFEILGVLRQIHTLGLEVARLAHLIQN